MEQGNHTAALVSRAPNVLAIGHQGATYSPALPIRGGRSVDRAVWDARTFFVVDLPFCGRSAADIRNS